MSGLYTIGVKIFATAYIKADTPEEAIKKFHETFGDRNDSTWGDHELLEDDLVSGKMFDDPDLPDVSLSPAITLAGPSDDKDLDPKTLEYEDLDEEDDREARS